LDQLELKTSYPDRFIEQGELDAPENHLRETQKATANRLNQA
jgi:hypothetical protein